MKISLNINNYILCALMLLVYQQVTAQSNEHLIKIEDRFYDLVDPQATVEKLADGFQFTEGPVWNDTEKYLLFSDIPANKIFKWTEDGKTEIFREPSNNSNGLTYDQKGNLVIAEHSGRKISQLTPEGDYSVIADTYEGKKLNSPNDVIVGPDDAYYFTDPPYGRPGDAEDPLDFFGVYRFHNGEIQVLVRDLYRPNGLAFSPDGKILYVANSDQPKKYMQYHMGENGKVTKESLLLDVSSIQEAGSPDGIKVDTGGNLFCTGPGGVLVISPDGTHLGTIQFPEVPSNCAFGGEDRKTLYVTARTGIYRIKLKTTGLP